MLAWGHWFRDEWNRPNRLDHYLMLVACEVRRVLAKEPQKIQPHDFNLQFSFKKTAPDRRAAAEKKRLEVAAAKARWGAFVGAPPPKEMLGPPPQGLPPRPE